MPAPWLAWRRITASHHCLDGRSHGLDVAAVQRGHADAAGVHTVDAEFAAQALHLAGVQAGVSLYEFKGYLLAPVT